MLSVSFWLISLNIMCLKSIHVVANERISSFFMAEYYSTVSIYQIFFIHSSVNGHLGYFHIVAIVNSAIINIGRGRERISCQIPVLISIGHVPRIARLHDRSICNFLRNIHIVFCSGWTN